MGVGNDLRYQNALVFDPFPFPDLTDKPALKSRLDDLGERLDAHRKAVLDKHDFLTMTKLYNVLERVRALEAASSSKPSKPMSSRPDAPLERGVEPGPIDADAGSSRANGSRISARIADASGPASGMTDEGAGNEPVPPLTDAERDIYDAGLVGTLKSIHDDIDAAVFEAYGWPADLDDEAILERLVALNLERHEEEQRGQVRWPRPDFQIPRFAPKSAKSRQDDLDLGEAEAVEAGAKLPPFPAKDRKAQARIVRELLEAATGPVSVEGLARQFAGKNTKAKLTRVADMLDVMEALGQAEMDAEGRYFVAG